MRKTIAILPALLLAAAAAFAAEPAPDFARLLDEFPRTQGTASERLQRLFDLYWDWAMHEFPEGATYVGYPGQNHRWTDRSAEAMARRDAMLPKGLAALQSIDRTKLTPDEQVNYDLFREQLEDGIEGLRFPDELLPISQVGGVQQGIAQLLTQAPARTVQDYEDLLARLRGIPTVVDQTLALLREGLEKGVTPPRVTLRDVPQQVANQIVEDPLKAPVLGAFTRFPETIPAADQVRLREAAVRAYREQAAPAFQKLHRFLADTYVPGARESIAMKDLPDGEAWYAWNVRQSTTTDLTPRQIHDIGLAEVKRIRAEMDRVIADSGFAGTFEEFTDFLRTDPRFFFDQPEDLLAAYRDVAKRADPELARLFGRLPRLPYGVNAVPAYAEKSQTTAYYEPGSLDAGRPGYFVANTYDLKTRPKWEMEALTLHEAVPGHHLQIAIAQELEELPKWRRFQGYTAFTEGWGLYAESLGGEMGFYKDPYAKFGQLTYEMWRAVRLVVDTGMHSLGWSRQQAIDFFKANTAKTEHDITVEVDRYIVWPGQALAYKIGELKIKELRAMAEKELGDKFDVRAFHDQVLRRGSVPLSVLETNVKAWVERARAGGDAAAPAGAEG